MITFSQAALLAVASIFVGWCWAKSFYGWAMRGAMVSPVFWTRLREQSPEHYDLVVQAVYESEYLAAVEAVRAQVDAHAKALETDKRVRPGGSSSWPRNRSSG